MRWDGVTNGLVSAGSVIQRDDLVQYIVQADATSAGGVLRVPVVCSMTGITGNMDDGEALSLVTPVNGLSFRRHGRYHGHWRFDIEP